MLDKWTLSVQTFGRRLINVLTLRAPSIVNALTALVSSSGQTIIITKHKDG